VRRLGIAVLGLSLLMSPAKGRAQEPIPTITLADALKRAIHLDPDYVRAVGQIDNAEWGRRAARLAFIIPALTAELDATKYSAEFFNLGTSQPQSSAVTATLAGSYEIFRYAKFTDLSATQADLESARPPSCSSAFRPPFWSSRRTTASWRPRRCTGLRRTDCDVPKSSWLSGGHGWCRVLQSNPIRCSSRSR
jgi:hypothetical protein